MLTLPSSEKGISVRRTSLILAIAAITTVALAVPNGTGFGAAGIALQLPWPTGEKHDINKGYTYGCQTHVGIDEFAIDFRTGRGAVVVPVADGTVVKAGWAQGSRQQDWNRTGYGIRVIVDHDNGYSSLYAHLDRLGEGIDVGAKVFQGSTALGLTGGSGNFSPAKWDPHLHFSLNLNGAAALPEPMSGITNFGQWGVNRQRCVPPDYPYVTSRVLTSTRPTSSDSPPISAPPTRPALDMVRDLSATPLSQTAASLRWSSVARAENYRVYRRNPDGASSVISLGIAQTTLTDSGLTCGKDYAYTVVPYQAGTSGPLSNTANVTTYRCPASTPPGAAGGSSL
ncbi:MAG: peptidoglycan DD-metalloendopeptidase family protein [Chloroflexi bacterium]|nr:peptidoglycan DD-metalloendopeptidase family protein [Chloroflexota bacterium]